MNKPYGPAKAGHYMDPLKAGHDMAPGRTA